MTSVGHVSTGPTRNVKIDRRFMTVRIWNLIKDNDKGSKFFYVGVFIDPVSACQW
jgi:hypothetical protein